MEFIFGNSGSSYGLLHSTNSGEDGTISETLQKDVAPFDPSSVSENLYAYKATTNGTTVTTIFNMSSGDTKFDRPSFYAHAKWSKTDKEYLLHRAFFEKMLSGFAMQNDIDQLRETHSLGTIPDIPAIAADAFDNDLILCTLNAIHSNLNAIHSNENKIVVGLDVAGNAENFDNYARGFIKRLFEHLSVNLRIQTSYITSCNVADFIKSVYRLCVVPADFLNGRNHGLTIINKDSQPPDNKWSSYLNWIIGLDVYERDQFFLEYERVIGRYTNISKSLLEYYDVRKSIGDVSKLLLKHTDEPNFAVPENQREKLQKHHSVRSGFIMGDVQIDFDNIEDFVKSNRAKLKYLSHIYGEKPITELESIISESFRSLEWGEIESILQYISDNAHGQNDINKVVRERIAVHAAELLSGKLDDVKVENRKLNAEKEELRGELETANEKKKELEGTINEYGTMLQAANDKKEELQSKVTDTEAKLSAAEKETEEKLSAAKKEVEELNKELKKANKNNPLRTLLSKIKIPLFQSKRKATEEIGNQPLINDEGDLERIEHDFGVAVTSSQDEGSSEVSQQHQDESFNGITGDDFDDSTDNIDIADNFTPSSQDSEDSSEANQPHQDEPSDEQSTGYSEQGFDGFNNDDVDDTDDNHNPLSQDSESSNEDNQPHQDESQSTKYAPSSFKDLDDVIRCYKDKSEGSNEDNQPSQDESQSTSDPEPSPSSQDFNPQDYSDWKEIIQRYQNELLNNQIIGYLEKYYDLHECDFGGFTKFILKFIEKDSDKIKKFLETQFPQKPTSKAAGILLMDLERDEYTREITILHNISIVEDYEEFKGKVAELGKIKKEKKLAAYHAIYKGMEKIIERETYKKFLESIPNIEIRRSSKKVIFASLRHSIWRRNIKKAITAFAPHIAWKHKIKIFSDHKKIKKIQNNAAKFGIKFEPDSSNTNPNPMSDESTQETNGISSTNKARTDVDYNTYKREEMTDEDSKKDKIPQGKRSKKRHWMYFMRMPHVSNKLFYGILAFFAVALVVIGVVSYLFS